MAQFSIMFFPMQKQTTDFQFDDDVNFNERANKITQGIIVAMAVFVLAGIAGLFGYGLWTKKTEGNPDSLKVEYELLLRGKKETPLIIFAHSGKNDSLLKLYVSTPYFERAELKTITPTPLSVTLSDAWYIFTYPVNGEGMNKITINTLPVKAGSARFIAKYKEKEVSIGQFIFP